VQDGALRQMRVGEALLADGVEAAAEEQRCETIAAKVGARRQSLRRDLAALPADSMEARKAIMSATRRMSNDQMA